MVSYFLSDFDGTMTKNGAIESDVYQAITDLRKYSVLFFIVTGRPSGWGHMMINTYPVDGVVCENGAIIYYKDAKGGIVKKVLVDLNTSGLRDIQQGIQDNFPGLEYSDDNLFREADIAIVLNESYHSVEADLLSYLTSQGLTFKISNIHLNVWKGDFNKKSGIISLMQELGITDYLDKNKSVYIGDSPNDEPLFELFHHTYGVANIAKYLPMLKTHPAHLTEQEEGAGFVEAVSDVISLLNEKIIS